MILQALHDYYQRKAADPESGIAPEGFEWKEIPFLVVIDRNGKLVNLEDTRTGEGKKKRATLFLVPQGEKKASGIKANLLWDNPEYTLGANPRQRDDIQKRHEAFRTRLEAELPRRGDDHAVDALLNFLDSSPVEQILAKAAVAEVWAEILESNANLAFKIASEPATICDGLRPWLQARKTIGGDGDVCLVTGLRGRIKPTHPSIKGVRDAQSMGASLVSFNLSSFTSYGKSQNFNAPVSEGAVFAYTTALNELLGKDSKNKLQVGDATTIFWADRQDPFEDDFAAFFGVTSNKGDDPDREINAVRTLYRSIETGAEISRSETRFFVLGLAPNAARLAVRFWHAGTVAEFSARIRQHFDDLEIVRGPKDQGRLSLFWHLVDIATEGKADNIPPNLAGDVVRAILQDTPYPAPLLHQTIRRIRAKQEVTRIRASLLKAYLNRFQRTYPSSEKEILVALDPSNTNAGYRLGRLFALLEKIQEDAQPGINATIRERYYGAASASPVTVFPQLLKLKNHHLAKLENTGFRIAHERRLTEVISGLPADMPPHLTIEDQARFAIGYYHQRQALFTKSENVE